LQYLLNDGCDDIFFASLGKLFHKVDAINENRRFPALDLAFGMYLQTLHLSAFGLSAFRKNVLTYMSSV
jgi:hypothetical protein